MSVSFLHGLNRGGASERGGLPTNCACFPAGFPWTCVVPRSFRVRREHFPVVCQHPTQFHIRTRVQSPLIITTSAEHPLQKRIPGIDGTNRTVVHSQPIPLRVDGTVLRFQRWQPLQFKAPVPGREHFCTIISP